MGIKKDRKEEKIKKICSGKRKNCSKWGFGGILIVAIFIFAGWYFYDKKNTDDFKLITNDDELAVFMKNMKEGDLEEYLAKKDELYAQDIYGGDTPEETLSLYIEALKSGDMELASKYFKLEDQERELDRIVSLRKISLGNYINMLESFGGAVYCNDDNTECDLNGFFRNTDILIIKMIKNTQTKKWKMESLRN